METLFIFISVREYDGGYAKAKIMNVDMVTRLLIYTIYGLLIAVGS